MGFYTTVKNSKNAIVEQYFNNKNSINVSCLGVGGTLISPIEKLLLESSKNNPLFLSTAEVDFVAEQERQGRLAEDNTLLENGFLVCQDAGSYISLEVISKINKALKKENGNHLVINPIFTLTLPDYITSNQAISWLQEGDKQNGSLGEMPVMAFWHNLAIHHTSERPQDLFEISLSALWVLDIQREIVFTLDYQDLIELGVNCFTDLILPNKDDCISIQKKLQTWENSVKTNPLSINEDFCELGIEKAEISFSNQWIDMENRENDGFFYKKSGQSAILLWEVFSAEFTLTTDKGEKLASSSKVYFDALNHDFDLEVGALEQKGLIKSNSDEGYYKEALSPVIKQKMKEVMQDIGLS